MKKEAKRRGARPDNDINSASWGLDNLFINKKRDKIDDIPLLFAINDGVLMYADNHIINVDLNILSKPDDYFANTDNMLNIGILIGSKILKKSKITRITMMWSYV